MVPAEELFSGRRLKIFAANIGCFKRCKARKLARAELSFSDMGSAYKEN